MYSGACRPNPSKTKGVITDCKSVYAGSIPTSASTIRKPRRLTSAGFFFVRKKAEVFRNFWYVFRNLSYFVGLTISPTRR